MTHFVQTPLSHSVIFLFRPPPFCTRVGVWRSLHRSSDRPPSTLTTVEGWLPSSSKCPESVHLFFTLLFNPHSDKWANGVIAVITICHKKAAGKVTPGKCVYCRHEIRYQARVRMIWCVCGARFTYLHIKAKRALNYVLTECHWWLMGLYIYFLKPFLRGWQTDGSLYPVSHSLETRCSLPGLDDLAWGSNNSLSG